MQQIIQNSKQQQEEESYEEEEDDDLQDYTQEMNVKSLFKNMDSFMQQINRLNEQAVNKIKQQKHKEGLKLLQQSEQMLEFAANCGRIVDRNLIIIILYNQACAYQCQWVLEKCSKYLDGVIYNMEIAIKEDEQELETLSSFQEKQAQLVKRQTFLVKAYLQFTAILSQLGKHKQALINSQKAAQTMRDLFRVANQYSSNWLQQNGSYETATTSQSNTSNASVKNEQQINIEKKKKDQGKTYQMKDEIEFGKLVIDGAQDILKDMANQVDLSKISINEKKLLKDTKKSLYYWKNNPENNEKHLRKELKLITQNEEYRSLLGIQNLTDWIKNFNIGSIMHMSPQLYDDFTSFGEMIYELAKRQLLEKVIYLSISYFTIATELRFIELEKAKQLGIKEDKIESEEFKLSEIYHLKSIEIACKHITTQSPYISHLISSYHKHYNANLDIIKEESILSSASEQSEKTQKKINNQNSNRQYQIQIGKDMQQQNKFIEQQDYSPKVTGNFIKSFLNSRSPPKQTQQQQVKNLITETVKIQKNLIESMINQKKSSDSSPLNQRKQQGDFDFSVYLRKNSNQCNLTNNNISQLDNSQLGFQLQPYKNSLMQKYNFPTSTKQQSPKNDNQLKTFLSDACRTERQTTYNQQQQTSFTPISYRVNNRSPDSSYLESQKSKQQQIHQNKTPQNRPRTNTDQQQQILQPSFNLKLETIQQLLKNKTQNGKYK